jgi:RNA-directed DNA polymerase
VNCYIKTGSSANHKTRVLVTLKFKRQQDYCGAHAGSIRTSRPEQARTRKNTQDYILNNEILNTGNPEKAKAIEVELLSNLTINLSRLKNQVIIYRYGGKIIEKANASSNFDDNGLKKHYLILWGKYNNKFVIKTQTYKRRYQCIIKNVLSSLRLNSILFTRSDNITCTFVRNYSQKPYEEGKSYGESKPYEESKSYEEGKSYKECKSNEEGKSYKEGKPNKEEKYIIWNKYNWEVISESVRKKQVKLAETAVKFGKYDKNVVKLQEAFAISLEFRLLAVYNISNNKGSKTPGEDGITLIDDFSKSTMVEELRNILINSKRNKYKSGLMRKVYIPISKGKLISLGIPNIKDRCLQELLRLVLDPVVEPFSDRNSYGFRKYRSAKNALGAVRSALQNSENNDCKYILDADIRGFFDEINSSWLINNIPLGKYHKSILESWLKAGILTIPKGSSPKNNILFLGAGSKEKELIYSEEGTPQGGIISPLLINFTLNGLENVVLFSIKRIVANDSQVLYIQKEEGKITSIRLGVKCVRYIDHFIILARNKRILTNYIKPAIIHFLKERGLKLSSDKTKIFGIRNEPLDFLGYTFKYHEKWRKIYSFFKEKIGKSGVAMYPNKEKLLDITNKIKELIDKASNDKAYTLITKLNPLIRGWSNYYNLGQSLYYRNKLRFYLYKLCWRWAQKKHPKWGKKKIALKYFLGEGPFKGRKWIFRGSTVSSSRFTNSQEGKRNYLIDPTVIVNTVSGIKFNIPDEINNIHAYNKDYLKLVEFQTQTNFLMLGKEESFKGRLFKSQKGICVICNKPLIIDSYLKFGNLHLDHIQPFSKTGSNTSMKNFRLIHFWCHQGIYGK